MTAFDGEWYPSYSQPFPQANSHMSIVANGDVWDLSSTPHYESTAHMSVVASGWYSQTDSLVVITNHYHKRGWRTESNDYVEWESTDRNSPYPGGGTVEPAVGIIIFQWTTSG